MTKNVSMGMASVAALAAGTGVAQAQDWTGMYAGLMGTLTNGTSPIQPYVYDEGYTAKDAGAVGAFVGVRWGVGDTIVMGAEIAIQSNVELAYPESYGPDDGYSLGPLVDAKLSVGVPLGNALIYGFAGVSATNLTTDYEKYSGGSGMNYGVGIDYAVTDKISVGMEYISRNMSGYTSSGNPDDARNLDSISLRASFHF